MDEETSTTFDALLNGFMPLGGMIGGLFSGIFADHFGR